MNTTTFSRIITPAIATAAIGLGFLSGLGGVHGAAAGEVAVEGITLSHEGFEIRSANHGAKGGNVEFEWHVEEGESAPPASVDGLAADVPDSSIRPRVTGWFPTEQPPRQHSQGDDNQFATDDDADGAKGGNVEFEWKVEEGES